MLDSIDRAPKAVNLLPYVGVNPLLIWIWFGSFLMVIGGILAIIPSRRKAS